MKRFFNWLATKISPRKASPSAGTKKVNQRQLPKNAPAKQAVPRSQPEYVEFDANVDGQITDAGPGKNVLKRRTFLREETGTHETLSILDVAVEDNSDEDGIDPYNTGQFDRSKSWDKRFRKD